MRKRWSTKTNRNMVQRRQDAKPNRAQISPSKQLIVKNISNSPSRLWSLRMQRLQPIRPNQPPFQRDSQSKHDIH